jgi:hypothetical protein
MRKVRVFAVTAKRSPPAAEVHNIPIHNIPKLAA